MRTYSLAHGLPRDFTYLLAHALTRAYTYSLAHARTYSRLHLLTRARTHLLAPSLTHSRMHLLTYWLTFCALCAKASFACGKCGRIKEMRFSAGERLLWGAQKCECRRDGLSQNARGAWRLALVCLESLRREVVGAGQGGGAVGMPNAEHRLVRFRRGLPRSIWMSSGHGRPRNHTVTVVPAAIERIGCLVYIVERHTG